MLQRPRPDISSKMGTEVVEVVEEGEAAAASDNSVEDMTEGVPSPAAPTSASHDLVSMGDVQKLTPAQESPSRNDQDVSSGFVLVPDDEDLIPDDVVQGVVVEAEVSPQSQSPEKQRQGDDRGGGDDEVQRTAAADARAGIPGNPESAPYASSERGVTLEVNSDSGMVPDDVLLGTISQQDGTSSGISLTVGRRLRTLCIRVAYGPTGALLLVLYVLIILSFIAWKTGKKKIEQWHEVVYKRAMTPKGRQRTGRKSFVRSSTRKAKDA